MPALFCLLWAHVAPVDLREYRVDVIEFNQVTQLDESGRVVGVRLNQWIFWDWHTTRGEFLVRDWRRWSADHNTPEYDHKRREWRLLFKDNERWITIIATSYVLTRSDHDPEVENRKRLTPERRRRF